jgi:ubiquinone/menaquinone biosynthesis C-methylase UbiE
MAKEEKGVSLDYLSNYYDLLTPAERSRFRRRQIDLVGLCEGEKVLEVGCGTGALSFLSKLAVGETGEVAGIDIAPKMVSRAEEKAARANLDIAFEVTSIDELPYSDEYFDVVISSMMFHHLPVEVKRKGLGEVRRVLKGDGRLFLCDFCSPHWITIVPMYLMLLWTPHTRYQLFGRLPGLLRESGFETIELLEKGLFLEYYLIGKAGGSDSSAAPGPITG